MRIVNVSKKVKNKVILKDISFTLDSTGVVFVMGKSGAGKSTLFNVMSGIDAEYNGQIVYDNGSCDLKKIEWYRQNILGIVFQDFNLINCLNVKENILLGIKIAGKIFNEDKYNEIVNMLDIKKIEKRKISNLSGGEKQRVAIARALLRDDKIIFADEPSGSLDEENTRLLFSYIKKLGKDRLFVIITHDILIANEFGDRVIEIRDGEITSDKKISNENRKKLCIDLNDYLNNKMDNRWIISYSLKNFWQKRKKTIGIILITTIALICIMFILGFKSAIDRLFSQIDSSILENDKYIYYENDDRQYAIDLDNNIINKCNNEKNIAQITSYYNETINLITDLTEIRINYDVIENNDFYKTRYTDIDGKLPKKSNEIMIDIVLAESLFGKKASYVGEKIKMISDSGFEEEITITAVKLVSSKDDGELYILEELSKKILISNFNDCILIDNNEEQTLIESHILDKTNEILIGREPNNENEIVISDTAVNLMEQIISSSGMLFSLEDIQNGSVNDRIQKNIFDKKFNLYIQSSLSNIGEYEIVGVCKSDKRDDNACVYFNKTMLEKSVNNKSIIFLKNIADTYINELEKMLSNKYGCLEQYSKGKSNIIQSKISLMMVGLVVLTVIIIIMSAMMIHFFMKISIYEQHYEIGVMLSLGMSGKMIRKMLMIEQLILGFCIAFFTVLIIGIFNIFNIDKYCVIEGVSMYYFEYWHIISIVVFSVLFISLSSYHDIVSATKKNIVKLLVEK